MPAPSANNALPWQFLIITDKAKIAAICRAHPYARFDADAVIIPFGKKEGYKWFYQDMPAANLGLGSTWCGMIDDREASVYSVAGLPNVVFGFALIPIGIPAEGQPPRTQYHERRVHWETCKP
jgi:nitroreductase